MSYVLEINDARELDQIRLLWDDLVRQTPGASFFQTIDWLGTYWRHFGTDQRLRVLVAYGAGRPIGILPLCVRSERYGVGRLSVLTYPTVDWGMFYGPIGPNPAATLLAAMRHIRSAPRDWDLLDLRGIGDRACDRGRTKRSMRVVGLPAHQQPWRSRAVVDLSETWDAYLASRMSRWQNNYRRSQRMLSARGKVAYIHYRPAGDALGDGDPRWDLFNACEEVARRGPQEASSDPSTLSNEAMRPFFRDLHRTAAAKGAVDLNLLTIDGRARAFTYNVHFQGNVVCLGQGFDPELSRDGAGNVIQLRGIRNSFEQGDTRYDLGTGSIESKRHLLTHVETSFRCTHFPAGGLRVRALRIQQWLGARREKTEPMIPIHPVDWSGSPTTAEIHH